VETRQQNLVPLLAAFWAETLEVLTELLRNVGDANSSRKLADDFTSTVQKRLQWLSEQMKKFDPANASKAMVSQNDIDALIGKGK
jgi:hypothetical protein